MNIVQVEENLKKITTKFSKESFIFDLMQAYGFPNSTISKLKIKLKKNPHEDIIVTNKLHFLSASKKELDSEYNKLIKSYSTAKKQPRFVIVTDFQTIRAYDTKMGESLDTEIKALSKHPDFFLPWAGIEKKVFQGENPADVKAAEKLAKVFDLIKLDNPKSDEKSRHALNVFLTRVLFCFFAEDTSIFDKGLFTTSIASHTSDDGKDLSDYFSSLFVILNTDEKKRPNKTPEYLNRFPYVNGGLFAEEYPIPKFSKKSRTALVELGDLNWAEINPDIFGSMIQAVVHPDQRSNMGVHYTSVTNIMKVLEPLILTELKDELLQSGNDKAKLKKLRNRISKIRFFDPACGSGNFLITAFKEIRKIEIEILKRLGEMSISDISLSNFYGIEIDDFAHEIAKLSLWLADHQMNIKFKSEFGQSAPTLPLQTGGHIVCMNATRIDWAKVCPKVKDVETYIVGNPPYIGFNMQSPEQTADIRAVMPDLNNFKFLDYIVCWFILASRYIDDNSRFAFVTTNSVCQGVQVPMIWPKIFELGLEINFAYPEFTWTNNAKNKAAVICSIIGVRKISKKPKYIFEKDTAITVSNINAYLVNGGNAIVVKRQKPLSHMSEIAMGNVSLCGGHLMLSEPEAKKILNSYPDAKKIIKKITGSKEFINGITRYCIWIEDKDIDLANKIPPIKERIKLVKISRENAGKIAKNYTHVPHRFYMTNTAKKFQIVVPRVSSMRREYIPIGYLPSDTIVSEAQVIYDPEPHIFGLINSRIHMVWMRALAGRLKSDYRYSSVMCYNTFPVPVLSDSQKDKIIQLSNAILGEREKSSDQTLAKLYDPLYMPNGLRAAHEKLDLFIDSIYKKTGFNSDKERLQVLFDLYQKMSQECIEKADVLIDEDEDE